MMRSTLAAALVVLCASATDAGAEFKASAVSLFIPSGIGGGYDAYARLAGRHLGRFLPGNPAILPKNMGGAGGVVLANYMSNVAPKDGSAPKRAQMPVSCPASHATRKRCSGENSLSQDARTVHVQKSSFVNWRPRGLLCATIIMIR